MQETDKNVQILMNTLGKIIKNHREKQAKSIYKISAEILMSKATWREAEIGACKNIRLTTLWKIAEGLDIPPYKLIEELSKELGDKFSLADLK